MTETCSPSYGDDGFVWALQKPTMNENGRNLTKLLRVQKVEDQLSSDKTSLTEPFLKPVLHDSGATSLKSSSNQLHTRFDESVFVISGEPEQKSHSDSGLSNADPPNQSAAKMEDGVGQTAAETIPGKPGVSAAEVVGFFMDKVSRNKGQIRLNCFLFLLVGLILTAIIVFVVVEPEEADSYQITLSEFATFWPLKRRLSVYHPFMSKYGSLEILWGYHLPPTGNSVPSYCSKRGGIDCVAGNCCLRYPGHSRLYLSSFAHDSASCVKMNWLKEERTTDETFYFSDCFFIEKRHWYGGVLEHNVTWPINWNNSSKFRIILTVEGTGVVEAFWISGDGYSVQIDSSGPLFWNFTKQYFCLKSMNGLNYTVCEAESLSDLYATARRNDQKFTNISSLRLKNSSGTTFLSLNATALANLSSESRAGLSKAVQYTWKSLPSEFAETFVLAFEDTHIFDKTHSFKCLEFIHHLKNELNLLKTSVEISNFVDMEEVEKHRNFWEKLVWQKGQGEMQHSTGLVIWRNRLNEVIDISDEAVGGWFVDKCRNWTLYKAADYATVTGGYASLLPAAAELNVSTENGNFYTKAYAKLASKLDATVLISSGFQSQTEPLYTTVIADCDNIESVIPKALSLSVLGYTHQALDIRFADESCGLSALRHLLELSMFFPVAKIPIEKFLPHERQNGTFCKSSTFRLFEETMHRFSNVRRNYTLPHYLYAMHEFMEHKFPLIRPMWWTQEASLRKQNREQTLSIHNQFMIGSDMVVVTFVGYPNVHNMIYLPKGTWYDPLWNGGTISVPHGQFLIYASNSPLACFVRVM